MDSNSEQYRKLFIGGLSYDTTEDSLREYFEKWGNIVDCVVMRDQNTKRSRGFGFVTYDTQEALNESQSNRPHVIDNKEVEAKRATPREEAGKAEARMSIKKIFVGGLAHEAEEDNLRDYFSTYGSVLNVDIIKDKETGKKRGFAFITFDDYDPVDRICMDKDHTIMGRRCDVRKALDKKDMSGAPGGGRGGRGGGRGGAGGGRGGRGGYSQGGYGGGGYNNYSNGSYNNGSGDNYSQGSSWGAGNQGGYSQGGSWGGSQGNAWGNNQSGWDNSQSGGGSWGGSQGSGSWDNSQSAGGSWGAGNQGAASYGGSGGGQGNYNRGSSGSYGSGGGGPMKSGGGSYSNRSSGGPYGGGYGGGYNNRR